MKTLNLCKTLLLVSTIFVGQIWGMDAEQEMRNLIERKKNSPYGPSDTFINFSQTFESSTPDDKATLVKIYEKLKSRDGVDSAIATIALEYKGQSVSELAKTYGVEVAAIGARAYGYQDGSSNWSRMPAAVAAPVRASAGQTIVDLDGNVLPLGGEQGVFTVFNNAKDFNLDVAQVKDQLLAQIRLIGVNPKNIPAYLKDLYDQLDAIQRGKPAAGPSYVAPYGMGARGSSASAAQYQNPNAAVEQEMLALAAEKAAGSYFTGRNATIDDFIATYDRSDPATKEKIVEIYTKLKKRDGEGYVIGGMANDIKRTGIFAFLAQNAPAQAPVVQYNAAVAPAHAPVLVRPFAPALVEAPVRAAVHAPAVAAQTPLEQMINYANKLRMDTPDREPSPVFTRFLNIIERADKAKQENLLRIYKKFVEVDGREQKEAITAIANVCQDEERTNEYLRAMLGVGIDNPVVRRLLNEKALILRRNGAFDIDGIDNERAPGARRRIREIEAQIRAEEANARAGAGGAYGYGAPHAAAYAPVYRRPGAAEEEAAGLALAQRLEAEDQAKLRNEHHYRDLRKEEEERASLELIQRLQEEDQARLRPGYDAAPYHPAAQNFGAGGGLGRGHEYPVAAPAPALQDDIKFEEFSYPEQQIIEAAYLRIMQNLQRPNADRIKQLERDIHTEQRVLDSVAGADGAAYTAQQIADAKAAVARLNNEREHLVGASAATMQRYAEAFEQAATPVLQAQTEGVQEIMKTVIGNGQNISYGKILGYLRDIMAWA